MGFGTQRFSGSSVQETAYFPFGGTDFLHRLTETILGSGWVLLSFSQVTLGNSGQVRSSELQQWKSGFRSNTPPACVSRVLGSRSKPAQHPVFSLQLGYLVPEPSSGCRNSTASASKNRCRSFYRLLSTPQEALIGRSWVVLSGCIAGGTLVITPIKPLTTTYNL